MILRNEIEEFKKGNKDSSDCEKLYERLAEYENLVDEICYYKGKSGAATRRYVIKDEEGSFWEYYTFEDCIETIFSGDIYEVEPCTKTVTEYIRKRFEND